MSRLFYCKVCEKRKKCLYVNYNEERNDYSLYCCACEQWFSLYEYLRETGCDLDDLDEEGYFDCAGDGLASSCYNESPLLWNNGALPEDWISAQQSKWAVNYLNKRGISEYRELFYDPNLDGITFPLYFKGAFAGGQTRLINPRQGMKAITLKGTCRSKLFFGWDQSDLPDHINTVFITEGPFDCLSLQKAFNIFFEGKTNPILVVSTLGSSVSSYQISKLVELEAQDITVIAAPDQDDAGKKMGDKLLKNGAASNCIFPPTEDRDWNDLFISEGVGIAKWILNELCLWDPS